MSEKMDGVRAYWNGKKLIPKKGNEINCPQWFIEHLPSITTLDGELWMGRGNTFANVNSILKSNGDWRKIGYYIFDIPSSEDTYEGRMKEMESLKPILPPHVHVVENIQCAGTEHLSRHLSYIVDGKGEGLMLRKPHTVYQKGYTASLLKVKVE
jgi:DNA ligase-1